MERRKEEMEIGEHIVLTHKEIVQRLYQVKMEWKELK